MRIFVKAAQCLNFTSAAKELGVSTAVITRGIAALEQHLHTRLVNRTTRSVSLTSAGNAYLDACVPLLDQLDSMDQSIASTTKQPTGGLRIAAASSYAVGDLPQIIAAYHLVEPKVTFEMSVFEDGGSVASNDFDICFFAERRLRDSSLVCRSLRSYRDVIVASPKYLARAGQPVRPEQLERHDVLFSLNAVPRTWEFSDGNGMRRVLVKPFLTTMTLTATKAALNAGVGIARFPAELIDAELRSGALRVILQNYELHEGSRTVWMVYSGQSLMPTAVRSFIDFVTAHYRHASPQIAA